MARIAVLSPFEPPPDGIGRYSRHLVDAWDRAGHQVLVLAPRSRHTSSLSEEIGQHSHVTRIVSLAPRHAAWAEARNFQPDVLVVQFAVSALGVNLWAMRSLTRHVSALGVPVVLIFHETVREYDLLGPLTRSIYRSWARVGDVAIALSTDGRRSLLDAGLFETVLQVPHGARAGNENDESAAERVRHAYGVTRPLVLTLGFTGVDKGTDVLLDAVPLIAEARGNDVQFLIAGSPRQRRGLFRLMGRRDQKFQRILDARVREMPGAHVTATGFIADDDVTPLLRVADVVALPYRRATQSGIANLALSSQAAIVATDLPGLRDSLGDAALYVAPEDARGLAEAITSLLGDDNRPAREQLRASAARQAAQSDFDLVAELILAAGLNSSIKDAH